VEITHPALPFPLVAHGDLPVAARLDEDGTVTVTGAARSDMFIDPNGPAPDYAAGLLLGRLPQDEGGAEAEAEADFTFSARVTVPFASTYDAGVLVVYAGPDRFAKLCFEYSPQHRPTVVTVVTRGVSDDANAFAVEGETVSLRVARIGRAWAFHASTDEKHWSMVRYFSLGETVEPVRVGLLAQSPTGEGISVTFAQLAYRRGTLADLRDGS
jgi:regulation of enolase protein 1 (concanavalin A-like superfamily)